MKLRPVLGILCLLVLTLSFFFGMNSPTAWGGSLRITMTDDTYVDVPYYWEEAGEVKFEVPGGVAGFPKDQVKSVREVVTAKEFDPEAIAQASGKPQAIDQQAMLRDLIASKTSRPSSEQLSAEEGLRLLKQRNATSKKSAEDKEKAYGPGFNLEGDFSELVRVDGDNVMLLLRNVVSSRRDLTNQSLSMLLYDGEGSVIDQKPCEINRLDVDRKTLTKMGIQGHLYSVTATVRPDERIRRYEITALTR